jgi:cell division protein FtsQ
MGRWIWRALRRSAPTLLALAGVGTVTIYGWLGWRWLHHSPRFRVRAIEIAGNEHVTRDQILSRAHLAAGENIFEISLRSVEKELRGLPWIQRVDARRRLPDGIVINVVEREAACLVLAGPTLYLATREGRPFKRADLASGEGAGLVVVSGIPRPLFISDPPAAAALVKRGLDAASVWGDTRPALGEVHVDKEGVTLYTKEGALAIALGEAPEPELPSRLERFDTIWTALSPLERETLRTIHLDSETHPDRVAALVTF